MIATLDRLPVQRPAWMRPLLLGLTAIFILKLAGVWEIPDEWLAVAVFIEIAIAAVEIAVVFGVIRYFFVRHRESGMDRLDAWIAAEVDEMKTAGFPPKLAYQLGRIMRWEANLYRRIGRAVKRLLSPGSSR